ncbi:MAG: T9SS type A sorting domain-containing protein [Ignavibacteriae bacterium]|nr:T9SS type A sorting domain-containing protein [Ignavibacteriota bacterium]
MLEANYPNPFNPSTMIRFSLPAENKISLVVYDMLGREVKTLIGSQEMAKGAYQQEWDGTNNAGQGVASGSYVYTLKFGNFSKSQKMMLVR